MRLRHVGLSALGLGHVGLGSFRLGEIGLALLVNLAFEASCAIHTAHVIIEGTAAMAAVAQGMLWIRWLELGVAVTAEPPISPALVATAIESE